MAFVRTITKSINIKTGPCSVTYRPQSTCPSACQLMNSGCYAETGPAGGAFKKVQNERLPVSQELAMLHFAAPRGGMVRLNVSGDYLDNDEVDWQYVHATNRLAHVRNDLTIFSYTHAWRQLWPGMFDYPVNASVDSVDEAKQAIRAGWQVALVDIDNSLTRMMIEGHMVIPCPYPKVQCVSCKLCAKQRKSIISFPAHGSRKRTVSRVLAEYRRVA
jgi:hypothetical protein